MEQGVNPPTHEEWCADIERELAAIEASSVFARSPVMRRLLRYVVQESMEGRGAQIKAYTLAVDGLGRDEDFDAQQDSYPRVQIGRLRKALETYYSENAPCAGLRFELRSGSYEILFVKSHSTVKSPPGRMQIWRTRIVDRIRSMPRPWLVVGASGAFALLALAAIGEAEDRTGALDRLFAHAPEQQIQPLPLVEVASVSSLNFQGESGLASLTSIRITDALRRSGWVRVRAAPAGRNAKGEDVPPADFLLRGKLYQQNGKVMLSLELVDNADQLVVWTATDSLVGTTGNVTGNLDTILARLVSGVVDPGGVIPERNYRLATSGRPMPGYTCMLAAAMFRVQRSVKGYHDVHDCLQRTVELQPRLSKAWALAALIDQDDVHFKYSGQQRKASSRPLEWANHAVLLDSTDAYSRSALSLLQYGAGDHRRAVENARQSYALNPYSSTLMTRAGNILFFAGDDRGLELVRRAIAVDPNPGPWFRQPLFFDAVMKGRVHDAAAEAAAMSEIQGTGRVYLMGIRAVVAGMKGDRASAQRYWSLVEPVIPEAAENPALIFTRMGASKPYAERSVEILKAAGALSS